MFTTKSLISVTHMFPLHDDQYYPCICLSIKCSFIAFIEPLGTRKYMFTHVKVTLGIIRCGEVYLTKNPPDPALFINKNTVHGNSINLPETELKTNSCHSCLELPPRSENLPISVGSCSRRGADENDEPASGLCICGTAEYGCTVIKMLDDMRVDEHEQPILNFTWSQWRIATETRTTSTVAKVLF